MADVITNTVPVRFIPHHGKGITSCKSCGRTSNHKREKLGVATGRPTVLLRVPTDVKVKDIEVNLREVLPQMTPPSYSWFGLRKRPAKPYGRLRLMIKNKHVTRKDGNAVEQDGAQNELVPLPSETVVNDLVAASTTAVNADSAKEDDTQLELYYSEERGYGDDDCCLALCALMTCCCACCAAEQAMSGRNQQNNQPQQNAFNPQCGYQNQQPPPPGCMPPNNNYYSNQGNQYGVPPPQNSYPQGGGGYPGQPMYYSQPPQGMQEQGMPPGQYGGNNRFSGGPL